MENFVFSVPTKIYFGRGQIEHLGEAIREYGSRVLLVYGGGSIKKIGLYGRITEILKAASVSVMELSGVEPNPKIASVREGVRLCREQKLDVVLAVGGSQHHRLRQGDCRRCFLRGRRMGNCHASGQN
jgi:alcohol dehydrogenase YqhD (iron-dependent ADH family)